MANDEAHKLEQMVEVVLRSIPKEREAQSLYRQTAHNAPNEMLQHLFSRLADQEAVHEEKLRAVLEMLRAELKELS